MPTLRTKLTSFWYEPEFQEGDKVKFQLRPLTQRDMVEIEEFSAPNGGLTRRAQYEAGLKAITAIRGVTDEDGNELRWPGCAPHVDRHLISLAGFRAYVEQTGGDWPAVVASISQAIGLDAAPADQPATAGDAAKN